MSSGWAPAPSPRGEGQTWDGDISPRDSPIRFELSRVQRRVLGGMAGTKMTINPWEWMNDSHLTNLPPARTGQSS